MKISINLASRPFVEIRPLLAKLRLTMLGLAVLAIGLGFGLHALSIKEQAASARMDALKAETERRVRAEEALLAASAERLLASESVALEASAREAVEVRAARLSGERDELEVQAEKLFSRLADEHAQAEAQKDVLRHLS